MKDGYPEDNMKITAVTGVIFNHMGTKTNFKVNFINQKLGNELTTVRSIHGNTIAMVGISIQ